MVPDQDQLAELAPLARVAFAARCARRVLPFFITSRLADGLQIDLARRSIELGEDLAARKPDVLIAVTDALERRERMRELTALEARYSVRRGGDRSAVVALWAAAHAGIAALETFSGGADSFSGGTDSFSGGTDSFSGGTESGAYAAYCGVYFAWIALETPLEDGIVGCARGKAALRADYARATVLGRGAAAKEAIRPHDFGQLWRPDPPPWAAQAASGPVDPDHHGGGGPGCEPPGGRRRDLVRISPSN